MSADAVEDLLGQVENQKLEFKRAAALEKPARIAREVVGMLNAAPGEVWVGVEDIDDRAVRLEGVPNAEGMKGRLLDSLLDTIEPRPNAAELEVTTSTHSGGELLCVAVGTVDETRRPFALLLPGGARLFVTRVDDRTRPMDRHQLTQLFEKTSAGTDEAQAARTSLRTARDQALERRERGDGFWLRIQPVPGIELDLQDPMLEALLREPERSRNFSAHHILDPYNVPLLSNDRLTTRGEAPTAILRDGSVEMWRPFELVSFPKFPDELGGFRLLTASASLFRLAAALYQAPGFGGRLLLADGLVAGARAHGLRAEDDIRHSHDGPNRLEDLDDLVFADPFQFEAREVVDEPDRCAARIVRRIYEAYGLREHAMPPHYDRAAGRLNLD